MLLARIFGGRGCGGRGRLVGEGNQLGGGGGRGREVRLSLVVPATVEDKQAAKCTLTNHDRGKGFYTFADLNKSTRYSTLGQTGLR